ncbi:unnamed protein product [Orchesella dallaii]|uniref:Uncharacterized protein n=1 Tax=Orchesella dallaii TaxID=48710 RepID=A0ABP1RNW6_9HEXA
MRNYRISNHVRVNYDRSSVSSYEKYEPPLGSANHIRKRLTNELKLTGPWPTSLQLVGHGPVWLIEERARADQPVTIVGMQGGRLGGGPELFQVFRYQKFKNQS